MQKWAAQHVAHCKEDDFTNYTYRGVFIRSCTGSGKTLAYLLPILQNLDQSCDAVQVPFLSARRSLMPLGRW